MTSPHQSRYVATDVGAKLRSLPGHQHQWRGLWLNATVVSGLTALVKGAGAVKTVVIARFFGATSQLDAYLLAFLIPSFIAEVLCGAIVPALVPRLVELAHQEKHTAAVELHKGALWRSVIFVGCIAIALAIVAGLLIATHTGGQRVTLACSLLLIMMPILPLSAMSNVWRATLNANQRFAVAAGASALTPLVIILSMAVAGPRVYWLSAATTVGALAETIALGLSVRSLGPPLLSRTASRWKLRSHLALPEYGALAITNFVLAGSLFLDQSMAAMLGVGAVSTLNYGTRMVAVLIAIGPEAFGITLLPRFSRLVIVDGRQQMRPVLKQYLSIAMFGSAIVAGVLVCFSEFIVKVLLKHGVFSASDTLVVTSVQRLSLLQLPFAVGVALLSRFIASARLNRTLIPISTFSLFLNAVLNLLLMRRFSVAGIALSTTFAQAAMFILLLMAVSRILRSQETLTC
jgi:putative peptidoglycan lipid II flippase